MRWKKPVSYTHLSHSENTAVTELHWENGSYELISLNDASHLTPELSTLGRQNWWRGSRYLDFNMWYLSLIHISMGMISSSRPR